MKNLITFIVIISAGVSFAQKSSENRDMVRANMFSFSKSEDSAVQKIENSPYIQPLSGEWRTKELSNGENIAEAINVSHGWSTISVPSKEAKKSDIIILQKEYKRPFLWVNRELFVRIEAVDAPYEVVVNGKKCAYNPSGKVASEFNITKLSQEGNNTLSIVMYNNKDVVDLQSRQEGKIGLIGEVFILSQPSVRVRDFSISAYPSGLSGLFNLGVIVKSHRLNPKEVNVYCEVYDSKGEQVFRGKREAEFKMKEEDTVRFFANVHNAKLWSDETPNLYRVDVKIQHEGRYGEYLSFNIGFRSVKVKGEHIFINDHKIVPAIKKIETELNKEALVRLKSEGYNTIWLPYPMTQRFYSNCDQVGLYVIDCADINTHSSGQSITVGGNASNNPSFEALFSERIIDMYNASKNHPSVIAFAIGDNTPSGYNMYEGYLALRRVETERPILFEKGDWNNDLNLKPFIGNSQPSGSISYAVADNATTFTVKNEYRLTTIRSINYTIWKNNKRKTALLKGQIPVVIAPMNEAKVEVPVGGIKYKSSMFIELSMDE